jgi:hypothetical protein
MTKIPGSESRIRIRIHPKCHGSATLPEGAPPAGELHGGGAAAGGRLLRAHAPRRLLYSQGCPRRGIASRL